MVTRIFIIFAILMSAHIGMTLRSPQAAAQSLTSNYGYNVDVIGAPQNKTPNDKHFIIRLSQALAVSGCIAPSKAPTIKTVDTKAVLYVTIQDSGQGSNATAAKTGRQYGLNECAPSADQPKIDLTFDAASLKQNGTYKINIKSETVGKLYEVAVTSADNYVQLTMKDALFNDRESHFTHIFYPENTIIVFAPQIADDTTFRDEVMKKMQARGLTPLNDVIDAPTPESASINNATNNSAADKLFFIDSRNILRDTLTDTPIVISTIETSETFLGRTGTHQQPVKTPVYAKRTDAFD